MKNIFEVIYKVLNFPMGGSAIGRLGRFPGSVCAVGEHRRLFGDKPPGVAPSGGAARLWARVFMLWVLRHGPRSLGQGTLAVLLASRGWLGPPRSAPFLGSLAGTS